MNEVPLYIPTFRSKICRLLAICTAISLMLLTTMVMLSYQQKSVNDKYSTSVNLTEAISKQWISTSGNIKSMKLVGDEILVIGDGRLTIEADRLPLERGRQYKIAAELELEDLGYRTYATILLTKTKGNRIWQLANSDEIAWQKNVAKKVTLGFRWSEDLENSNFVLLGYNRLAYEKTNNYPMSWRIKRISLIETEGGLSNPDGYIKYVAYVSIIIGTLMLCLTGLLARREKQDNVPGKMPFYLNTAMIVGGIIILTGVGIIDSFPIEALRLRADAWSYDIVARSIAAGLGFKAYDIVELTTYPVVPLYYSVIYRALGVSVVSVFWGNIILLVAAWISIAFCTLKLDRGHAIISLIILVICVPIWVSVTWTLSETLAMLMLTWVVIAASKIVHNDNHILWKSVLLGALLGVASLTRTDFYGLIPLLLAYFFLRRTLKTATQICIVTTFVAVIVVSPWWTFQSINKQNVIENNFWSSDLHRLSVAFDKIGHGRNIKGDQKIGIERFSSNLMAMIKRPYDKYVDETEPNRMAKNVAQFYLIHMLILIGTASLIVAIWRKRPLFLIGLPEIILLVVVSRTIFLSALHDSPRYFSHHALIIAMLFAISFKELLSWHTSPRRSIDDYSDG